MFLDQTNYLDCIDELSWLSAKCFSNPISLELLRWRYIYNPHSVDLLVNVEHDNNGRIVSNYSASPIRFFYKHESLMMMLSMTTMTHPAQAGKGLFSKLATECYTKASALGIKGVFGFPNSNSHRIFINKLQWNDIYEIPMFTADVSDIDVVTKPELPLIRDDRFRLEYSKPHWMDNFLHSDRSKEVLYWRYARHPINMYEVQVVQVGTNVVSYCIYKRFGNGLDVVDFIPANEDHARALLSGLVKRCRELCLESIKAWIPIHVFFRHIFEKSGFKNQEPITYFGYRPLDTQNNFLNPNLYGCFKNWFISMGDSDVY